GRPGAWRSGSFPGPGPRRRCVALYIAHAQSRRRVSPVLDAGAWHSWCTNRYEKESVMKSVVELEINAARDRVAALFSDPRNMDKWMDDMEYETLSGAQGEPGSTYHLGQRDGMWFTATVLAKELPKELRLRLDVPKLE